MNGAETIRERADRVAEQIARAAERCGRTPSDVRLVGASKTQPAALVGEALAAGVTVFGENYVQEAEEKIRAYPQAEWHLIGRLQRNKVKKAVSLFAWIQTVDSVEILEEISRRAAEQRRVIPVLLEVNLGSEESKAGVAESQVFRLVDAAQGLPGVAVKGLMAIPPWADDPEASRPHFRRLRAILTQCVGRGGAGAGMTELSMGMSNDFEAAIEEGATIVRVGTALFGSRTR